MRSFEQRSPSPFKQALAATAFIAAGGTGIAHEVQKARAEREAAQYADMRRASSNFSEHSQASDYARSRTESARSFKDEAFQNGETFDSLAKFKRVGQSIPFTTLTHFRSASEYDRFITEEAKVYADGEHPGEDVSLRSRVYRTVQAMNEGVLASFMERIDIYPEETAKTLSLAHRLGFRSIELAAQSGNARAAGILLQHAFKTEREGRSGAQEALFRLGEAGVAHLGEILATPEGRLDAVKRGALRRAMADQLAELSQGRSGGHLSPTYLPLLRRTLDSSVL